MDVLVLLVFIYYIGYSQSEYEIIYAYDYSLEQVFSVAPASPHPATAEENVEIFEACFYVGDIAGLTSLVVLHCFGAFRRSSASFFSIPK